MKKLNYVPHKAIASDDRDPPWVNKKIKKLIHQKNQDYKSYSQNKSNTFSFYQFGFLQSKLNSPIEKSKLNYQTGLSKKLSDPFTWCILKAFLNNKKYLPFYAVFDKFIKKRWKKAEKFFFSLFFFWKKMFSYKHKH